ncbi:MAG: hypothetical protein ACRCST_16790 [Turicibacter sp.]
MNKKHSITMGIIIGIILIGTFIIPNTNLYKEYRQSQFLMSVVEKTQKVMGYQVELNVDYNILGYQMALHSEGDVTLDEKQLSHLSYLVKMNGMGVSPMTVDLEQYATTEEEGTTLYMSLNGGQWFKEAKAKPSNYFDYFVDFNNINYLNEIYQTTRENEESSDFEILEDDESKQVISVKVDFMKSEKILQILITNLLNFSPTMNLKPVFKSAPKVEYIFTIDKTNHMITNYELNYEDGIQYIINSIKERYPSKFQSVTPEKLAKMSFKMDVSLSNMNEVESFDIPSNVLNQAVEVGKIK